MRIIYMGTPDFAVDTLKTLATEHEIIAVFCQPDKPKGRSGQPAFPPVKEAAIELGIPVYQPVKIRQLEYQEMIRDMKPDLAVVVAFGQILPQSILDIPKFGCVNVHASLLPKYRGSAPIQWSILNGDEETGVTIMQMDAGIDTGDILAQKSFKLEKTETADSLFDKLKIMGGNMVLDIIKQFEAGTAVRKPQGEATSEYAKMLTKEMGNIDWTESAEVIERKIRGFNSWPGAYTFLYAKQLKIWKSEISEYEIPVAEAGGVYADKNYLYVRTGTGVLKLLEIQIAGKKRMPADAFLRGVKIEEGTILQNA